MIVCCCARHNWYILNWLIGIIIWIYICSPIAVIDGDEVTSKATCICIGICLIVSRRVRSGLIDPCVTFSNLLYGYYISDTSSVVGWVSASE